MVHPSGGQAARPGSSFDVAATSDRDRGDVLLGWLTRVVAALAVVAVLGIDTVTVGMATVSSQDQANTAADAARDSYASHHDVNLAFKAAQSSALDSDATNVVPANDFTITSTGIVTLHLHRPIQTLVAHFLPIDGVKTATAVGSAEPSIG
ncbi:MAG: hypothetical protein M3P23_07555 [Actinomycetota bacterium]|nr:hypothetical protein [Actinomycetota bacterium]